MNEAMNEAMNNPMIEFERVTKRFGRRSAVDDFSLTVAAQRAVALWGPNGAGKTTAIKCLLGLLRYAGTIRIDGLDARRNGRAARRRIGYVPQEIALYPDMTAAETARFFARLRGAPAAQAHSILAQVGLDDQAAKPVGALSGGMKQRLALGLALLGDPPVLILDEPTSNLDRAARDHFLHLLAEVKAAGKTILYTSHRLEEIELLADEAIVMESGRVRAVCPGHALAQTLGMRRTVKLHVPAESLDRALQVLHAGGYQASRNGRGVLVEVRPDAKAEPIGLLGRAAIAVVDFELE